MREQPNGLAQWLEYLLILGKLEVDSNLCKFQPSWFLVGEQNRTNSKDNFTIIGKDNQLQIIIPVNEYDLLTSLEFPAPTP
jgi:hypothetical protein